MAATNQIPTGYHHHHHHKKRHCREGTQNKENEDRMIMEFSPGHTKKEMDTTILCDKTLYRKRTGLHDNVNINNQVKRCDRQRKGCHSAVVKSQAVKLNTHGHKQKGTPKKLLKKVHFPQRENKLLIPNPVSVPVLDDDFLPMDIDYPLPLKIREIQTRIPSEMMSIDVKVDPLSCPEYNQEIYQYLRGDEYTFVWRTGCKVGWITDLHGDLRVYNGMCKFTVVREAVLQSLSAKNIVEQKSVVHGIFEINAGISQDIRAILNDWLIQVQIHQELSQQTLHLAITLMDKILSQHKISVSVLQLLGVGCLLVAAKYLERFPPEVYVLCHLTDNSYKHKEVLRIEKFILNELKYDLNYCEPVSFLDRFLEMDQEDAQVRYMSQYLLDLTLTSTEFLNVAPSNIAASTLFLARKILQYKNPWSVTLAYYSMYSIKDVIPCAQNLAKMLLKAPTSKYKSAHDKFSSMSSFGGISNHPALEDINILKEAAGIETIIM